MITEKTKNGFSSYMKPPQSPIKEIFVIVPMLVTGDWEVIKDKFLDKDDFSFVWAKPYGVRCEVKRNTALSNFTVAIKSGEPPAGAGSSPQTKGLARPAIGW